MKKIKSFLISLSRDKKIVKLDIWALIAFVLISFLICYFEFFKQFGISLWILCLVILAVIEILGTLSNYDEDTIMENSLLNIILSNYRTVWWVIALFMLFIVRFCFKLLIRNIIIYIIVTLIVFILSDKLAKYINIYFKKKIKE